MKIGIALGTVRPPRWTEVTCEADRLGYESVWMPEHLVLPVASDGSPYAGAVHPPIPSDVPVFEPFAHLSYLAGRTGQIRFGTHVYNIGLRHPFVVARGVATLDIVSGGGPSSASGPVGSKPNGMPWVSISPAGTACGRGHRRVPAVVARAGRGAPR